jgi:hypothetical protein
MSRNLCGLKDVHEMPEHRVALLLRIRRELKEQLADFAKHEHRSLNQQIEFILEQFLSDIAKKPINEQREEERQGKSRRS